MAVVWFTLFILSGAIIVTYHRRFKIFVFGKSEFENLDIEMAYRAVVIGVTLVIQFFFLIKFLESIK